MAIVIRQAKRFQCKKVFRIVSLNPSQHRSARHSCFSHSIREELEKATSLIEESDTYKELLEKLMELIEEQACEIKERVAIILQNFSSDEKRRNRKLSYLRKLKRESTIRTKLLCAMQSVLCCSLGVKGGMVEKEESPPNSFLLCRREVTAAAV